MRKLSNYTHARYCTDEADIFAGLSEIKIALEHYGRMDKKTPDYFFIRKIKLLEKLKLIVSKGLRMDEFRYRGHIFKATRKFKEHEDFGYVGRRLTRLTIHGWDWDEFWICANTITHDNIILKCADIFLMDKDILVVPCERFLGRYDEI